MPYPIAVQLYSLRDQTKDGNHVPIVKKVADTGYKGVETAGLYGLKPREYRKLMDDHGLTITSHHGGLPKKEEIADIGAMMRELGTPYYGVAWLPPERFATTDSIKKVAEDLEAAREILAKEKLTLFYHNHDFEFQRLDGKVKLEILAQLCPKLQFQIDTYWASNFGAEDPAKMVAQFKDRAPLLHIKDGPMEKGKPMTAAGKGKQNFPAVFAAANPNVTKHVIVELDACGTDMMQAIVDSYHYLVGAGLATGNKPAKK
ncbi:MAG TPA: sugar phosphate isomerase/epimerase [Planctomycetota bacterium]|nr:sugar phosphate isomerase/epimerase [Planctomycetota bacterium]